MILISDKCGRLGLSNNNIEDQHETTTCCSSCFLLLLPSPFHLCCSDTSVCRSALFTTSAAAADDDGGGRPSQLAELSSSEFDPELFSHSAYERVNLFTFPQVVQPWVVVMITMTKVISDKCGNRNQVLTV